MVWWSGKIAAALSLLVVVGCATVERPVPEEKSASVDVENAQKKQRALASMREQKQLWVCEIENEAKIFTGVGASRDAATSSARASCAAHFQVSSCSQAECNKGL